MQLIAWVLSADAYRPAHVKCPRFAETLINTRRRGKTTINVAGGVQMNVQRIISRVKEATGDRPPAALPDFADDAAWWTKLPTEADVPNRTR